MHHAARIMGFLGAALVLASCGAPALIEGPVAVRTREGNGEFKAVGMCAFKQIEADERAGSPILGGSVQKTDLDDAVYLDLRAGSARLWRLHIRPTGPKTTRIDLISYRPVIETGGFDQVMNSLSHCLK